MSKVRLTPSNMFKSGSPSTNSTFGYCSNIVWYTPKQYTIRSGGGTIHSLALRINRMQNIDFPELDGPAMIAVNGCMNLGSIVSSFIVGNLAREVAIVFSNFFFSIQPIFRFRPRLWPRQYISQLICPI